MMGNGGGMWFGGGFMWLFWLLIIVVIVIVIKSLLGGGVNRNSTDSPLQILQKRYARGEIDEEEYKRRRRELEG